MKKRILYYDNVRYLAAILVFTWHFISRFTRTTLRYWSHGPSHYFLQGINGKFGVIVFCVVLGYFAAKSGRKKGSLAKYTLNRYIQFALMGVFVNTLYLTVDLFNVFPNKSIAVAQVIQSGLLLSDDIFPAFWCMKLFLLGGIICYANKKYEVSTAICLMEILGFLLIGKYLYYDGTWIAFILMGSLMDEINENPHVRKLLQKRYAQLCILLAIFCLFKRPMCQKTFFIQAVCAVAIFLILRNNETLTRWCSNRNLAKVGGSYMGFYLVHLVSYNVVCMLLYGYRESLDGMRLIIVYVVSLVVCVVAGYAVNELLNKGSSKISAKVFQMLKME